VAKLIVLSDFSPPARSNIWKAPRGVAAGDSAIYQRHPLSAASSRRFSLRNLRTTAKNPSASVSSGLPHTGLSFSWTSLAQNLICSNPIYLRNKLLGLPCLTLLCSRWALLRYYPLLRPTIALLHVPCIGKQFLRSLEDLVFWGLSIVCKICRYTWVTARHRGPMHHGSANRPTSSCTGYAVVSCSQTGSLRIAACPNRVCLEDAPSFSPQCEAKSCVRVVTNSNPRWLVGRTCARLVRFPLLFGSLYSCVSLFSTTVTVRLVVNCCCPG